jgi:GAF domain-containing protein
MAKKWGDDAMNNLERRYYHSLYQVAAAINSSRTPEKVLNTITETVAKALKAKGCSLMLLTPDQNILLHTADYGLSDTYVQKGPVSVDPCISEAIKGNPVAILDATEDKRVQYREQARQEGIASILSVPIMLREKIVGLIRVYTAEHRHFTEDDVYFVQAVANLGAIALENAKLYESVRKDNEVLRRELLEWRFAAMGVWPPPPPPLERRR